MAVKKAKAKSKKTKKTSPKEYVVIDFPQSGDIFGSAHYAVRIGASSAPVEISVDRNGWQACREAGGYFWYDWNHIPQGHHALVARIKISNGTIKKSKIVKCMVK